ncbi:MAG: PhzF family phenazine biosynthesis protein [Planctomycetota bacterium]|nr:PhzF family phenazine biosynthesis protein [Planctomycetota bacterium]
MAETIPLYQVDAFTDRPFAGNPAAVCLYETWLDDELLQAIAAENNLSETAFLVPSPEGDTWELRWMTPRCEVDLCGHATLAAAWVLFAEVETERDEIAFQTKSGPLIVRRLEDSVEMDFPALPPEAAPQLPRALAKGLGAAAPEVHLAGKHNFLCVFESEAEVAALTPDFRLLEEAGRSVIATAPGTDVDFVSRFFAPLVGVDEDPVTGSAHCSLAPYWAKRLGKDVLSARQISTRGGDVECEMRGDRVLLRGQGVIVLRGELGV